MKRNVSWICSILLCVSVLTGTAHADVVNGTDPAGASQQALAGSPFPDVPETASYAQAVRVLNEAGIIQGDTDGRFYPDRTVTRAQTAAFLCRMLGIEATARVQRTTQFSDVPKQHWASGYIAAAAEKGVLSGHPDGSFQPDHPVTCQQALKMLVCAWGWQEYAESNGGWPNGYVAAAKEYGYTENTDQAMEANATRSTIAVYIYNTMY